MSRESAALIAAIRATPWAIIPEYLEAIEAIAARALDADILKLLAQDGHEESMSQSRLAVAAVGPALEGARVATVRNRWAVVPMLGTIMPRASLINASTGGTSLDVFMHDVRVSEQSNDVDRLALLVDSPGGVVSSLGEVADALRECSKPITAFVSGMGASAAYWLASQASEIVMDRSASVGSIGVVMTMSRQESADQNGRRSYEVVSSGAPNKRPDPSTEEGRATIQKDIDAIEAVFIADVAAGRRVDEAKVREQFGKGAMVHASNAVAAGMADRIGTLESVLSMSSGRTRISPAGSRARASADLDLRRRAAQGV